MRRVGIEISRFAADRSGAIAIMFAMMLVPVLGVALTAIDYGRAVLLEGRLQTATDAAAAAAVRLLGHEYKEIEGAARRHLDVQLPTTLAGMPFELTIAPENKYVTVRVETTIPTSLIGILGLDKFTLRVSSQAFPERPAVPAKLRESIEQQNVPPDVARALEDLSRQGGAGGGKPEISREQQEQIRRASEEADRMIREALSRIGR